ncbi:helix-turn-helix domain-containing protein [Staphylococcus aureus]|uniref:helix-turn-helix domain-containing protein n=13 Tax=Staphylococcus aureus TaxID=1280 RepID=UPI00067D6199|nr:XRE family transcriptional regulator [Staphylococcus aureus]
MLYGLFTFTQLYGLYQEIYNTIEKLLNDKSISNYRINQDTGVSYGGISELRSGKRKVNNLTLETAEKLYNYQKQLEIMIED